MKIIECPRDAMQGLKDFIPTTIKTNYINSLLKVGFDTIDFGSFVSPKAIPQMRDTEQVLDSLDLSKTKSKLLAIIANYRGAEAASVHKCIDYLGFPLSISESFQQRNTNKSIAEAMDDVKRIQDLCVKSEKTLVVYLSMAFGNPYGEKYDPEMIAQFIHDLSLLDIKIISLSDTIGSSEAHLISKVFETSIKSNPDIEIGAHFHSTPDKSMIKVQAAYAAGCRRFDGALNGFGGCPMAKDDLTGNVDTQVLLNLAEGNDAFHYDIAAYNQAKKLAQGIFY
ncbi:MAG: hydroxymethylglutaryl-CoA lyase [Cyclobacteriaceae bacterium]|nr:hydroxymethylglutaryl-CoA lyase [Cyclobacteriaceae bacterium]MCH8515214.1 hydroxymethylglutaryl-CoA lyase [Cyclobacteriaceae bacterium]